jgi:hypothetical protein
MREGTEELVGPVCKLVRLAEFYGDELLTDIGT